MKKFSIFILLAVFLVASIAYATSIKKVTASITAENTFTEPISCHEDSTKNRTDLGTLNFQVYGFGTATVTLQAAYDYGTAWVDFETYTTDTFKTIVNYEPGVLFRAGVKTGDYTSGTINVRLSRVN